MQTISAGATALLTAACRDECLSQKVEIEFSRNATAAAPGVATGDDVGSPTFGYNTYLYSGWEQGFQHIQADGQMNADATCYPCEGSVNRDHEYNHGWWSAQKSESDGVFRGVAYDPYALLTYTGGRKGNYLYIESCAHLPYISKVKVYLDEGSGFDAGTEYELDTWYKEIDLGEVKTLTKVKVVAMETSAVSQPARFYQVDLIWRVTISASDIKSLKVTKRMEHLLAARLPYGGYASSELDLELVDDTGAFKTGGTYYSYMQPNVKITPYFGVLVGSTYTWVKQGTFYANDDWRFTAGLNVRVTARDRMKHLQDTPIDDCFMNAMTASSLFKNLCHRAHVRRGLISAEAFNTGFTHAGVYSGTVFDSLCELAKSTQAIFFFDEDGTLHIHNSSHSYGSSIATLTDADWTRDPEITEPERANQVRVDYCRGNAAPRQEVYTLTGYNTSVANGASKTLTGDFNKCPIMRASGVTATGSVSLTDDTEDEVAFTIARFTHDGFRFTLVVTNNSGATAYLTTVTIYGYPVAIIDDLKSIQKDADLVRRWGLREYALDLSIPINLGMASSEVDTLATAILAKLKGAKRVVKLRMQSRYNWQVGDKVTINSTQLGISSVAYYVNKIIVSLHDMELELVEV